MNGVPLSGAADVEEEVAHAAELADGRQHGGDDRKAQLGIGVERLLSKQAQVVVAVQVGVAAEVGEVWILTPALEPAIAQREQARGAEAHILTRFEVDGLL